ncbi:MAG TPA: hypothetical protein DCR01_05210 [Flavobacteriales bacterium]|nr:hypothetical protein [Flavobacteriales bacterium]
MNINYLLSAAIVLASLCLTSIKIQAMTDESRQEVIKLIYCDDFFSKPENRHLRDKFIKKIHANQTLAEEYLKNCA